ncbi:MAG: head decoration protein [Lachnospiraceae bacterium]|nr:head decoration protein [Lachnospiraceae bacterium]
MLIETFKGDNLIAGNAHTVTGQTVTVKSGEGELKRGSVLMRDADDKFVLADTSAGTAEVILAADVDATEADTVAEVFATGDFNANALIVADGYTLTEADLVSLKNAGIYISVAVPVSAYSGSHI